MVVKVKRHARQLGKCVDGQSGAGNIVDRMIELAIIL
jgi:hypothetical protein